MGVKHGKIQWFSVISNDAGRGPGRKLLTGGAGVPIYGGEAMNQEGNHPNETGPALSVVIPTMGRAILLKTLESLAAAEGFGEIEVCVAGKVPDAEVAAGLRAFLEKHPNVRHLDIRFEPGDSSRKKNAGAAATSAPLVAFLDDDVEVARAHGISDA